MRYVDIWAEALQRGQLVQTQDQLLNILEKELPVRVQTLNQQHLYLARRYIPMYSAIRDADYVTADGWPLVSFAQRRGEPAVERVTGKRLCQQLMRGAIVAPYALLGTDEESCEDLRRSAARHGSSLVVHRHGPVRSWSMSDLVEELAQYPRLLVLVALGAPHGEELASRLRQRLINCSIIGVGGGVDMAVGRMPSAPAWIERINLEWFYRLIHQPTRLGRRYLVEGPPVTVSLARELLRRGRAT